METAYWIDCASDRGAPTPGGRVYFGEETCERRLPSIAEAGELARAIKGEGRSLTLVTPFLTDSGMRAALRLIEGLVPILGRFEVVCSDWGLLWRLLREDACVPVLGRLLAGQQTDPRLARMFDEEAQYARERPLRHIDGTPCALKHRPPGPELRRHLASCSLDRSEVRAFLATRGVRRCEVSNVAQGLMLEGDTEWSFSLHLSEVLVAAMRRCPGRGEDFQAPPPCERDEPCGPPVEWREAGWPTPLVRRGNAIYCPTPIPPPHLDRLPVDRVVYRHLP